MSELVGEHTGAVKWFSETKGFGFIGRDGNARDIFLHASELQKSGIEAKTLQEGVILRFNLIDTPKGQKATNISRVV